MGAGDLETRRKRGEFLAAQADVDWYPVQLRELLVELAPCDVDGVAVPPRTRGLLHLVQTPPPGAGRILFSRVIGETTFIQLLDLYLVDDDVLDWPETDKVLAHHGLARPAMRSLLIETLDRLQAAADR